MKYMNIIDFIIIDKLSVKSLLHPLAKKTNKTFIENFTTIKFISKLNEILSLIWNYVFNYGHNFKHFTVLINIELCAFCNFYPSVTSNYRIPFHRPSHVVIQSRYLLITILLKQKNEREKNKRSMVNGGNIKDMIIIQDIPHVYIENVFSYSFTSPPGNHIFQTSF